MFLAGGAPGNDARKSWGTVPSSRCPTSLRNPVNFSRSKRTPALFPGFFLPPAVRFRGASLRIAARIQRIGPPFDSARCIPRLPE